MTPTMIEFLPAGFVQWSPLSQGIALGLMTYVLEDAPTLAASLLVAAGVLSWWPAFLGCFLGIWTGDALLYAAARTWGRSLLARPWMHRWIRPEALDRSERWFTTHGIWVLGLSRLIPGTRLPTYLAAGFLRVPLVLFLVVTGLAALLWTGLLFGITRLYGEGILAWTGSGVSGAVTLTAGFVLCWLLLRRLGTIEGSHVRRRVTTAIGRYRRWEFWPSWLFYTPVAAHCLRLAARYRSLTLPSAANPGMFSGGIVGESKADILGSLARACPEFTVPYRPIPGGVVGRRFAELQRLVEAGELRYPVVLKPDVGQRGDGVKVIRSAEQARDYLSMTSAPLVAQEFVPGPHEIGVFYYRFPEEAFGRILGITEKVFPELVGDGLHSIEELIWRDRRARFLANRYLARLHPRRSEVLPAGARLKLVETGNHAQGCVFLDGARLWSQPLAARIDEISKRIPGFHIGRYDIRYNSETDLRQGNGFKILELNGAASEVTDIYDPKHSLRQAYRKLFHQWDLVFAIADANRRRGIRPTAVTDLWRAWRGYSTQAATYPEAD